MALLEDMEFNIMNNGNHSEYDSLVRLGHESSKGKYIEQVRYMLNFANNAFDQEQTDNLMFIGGLGVLGNLVRHYGEKVIPNWRTTDDVDMVLKTRDLAYIVDTSFDAVESATKSLSIPSKLIFIGSSRDFEGRNLDSTSVDVFVPNGDPRRGIPFHNYFITENEWSKAKVTNVYGIPVKFADPVFLIKSKIAVHNSLSYPRKQDCEDLDNLLGILQNEGVSANELMGNFSISEVKSFRSFLTMGPIYGSERIGFVSPSTDEYRLGLVTRADEILEEAS